LNTVTDSKKNPNVDPETQRTIIDFKNQSKLNNYNTIKKKMDKNGIISKK
jgi:hypothetical protein